MSKANKEKAVVAKDKEKDQDKEAATPDNGSKYKDPAIFVGWISGLLILAAVFWVLTQPVRTRILANAVNRVLEHSGDSRRLDTSSSFGGSGFLGMGTWFTMTSPQAGDAEGVPNISNRPRAVVFSFIGEGAFFPCVAVLNQDGKVEEFIPLNSQGERLIRNISHGILSIYARRIEGARL